MAGGRGSTGDDIVESVIGFNMAIHIWHGV